MYIGIYVRSAALSDATPGVEVIRVRARVTGNLTVGWRGRRGLL